MRFKQYFIQFRDHVPDAPFYYLEKVRLVDGNKLLLGPEKKKALRCSTKEQLYMYLQAYFKKNETLAFYKSMFSVVEENVLVI